MRRAFPISLSRAGFQAAVFVLIFGGGCSDPAPDAARRSWYYNLQTRSLFSDRAARPSPFSGEGDGACYRAVVLKCPGGEPYLAWIEKDPETASAEDAPSLPMLSISDGEGSWHPLGTVGADRLVEQAMARCGEGVRPVPVTP